MMKTVYILTTGGTIGAKRGASGFYKAGAMSGDELISNDKMPNNMHGNIHVVVENIFQIASSAMSFENLILLKNRIHEVFENPNVQGVVVTHGTDTLEESAYFLSLCVKDERPVVLTGSQRSPEEVGTDAFANIEDAIIAAASPSCRELGTLVLFNETLYSARYVHKVHAFSTNAFGSYDFGVLGFVDGDYVHIAQRPVDKEEYYEPMAPFPRVEIYKASLDSDGALIDAAVQIGAKGIVLEGFGRGHICYKAADAISRAVENGVHVIISSDCAMGRVYPVYDFQGGVKDLESRGAIQGFNYAAKKARIKLSVLLASGVTDPLAIAESFRK